VPFWLSVVLNEQRLYCTQPQNDRPEPVNDRIFFSVIFPPVYHFLLKYDQYDLSVAEWKKNSGTSVREHQGIWHT
jgi:hypothetical protein